MFNYNDDEDEDEFWELSQEEYPFCCGIDIICCFPESEYQLTKKIKDQLKDQIKEMTGKNRHQGIIQITLNAWQNRRFGSLVRDCGFKLTKSFDNPNSHNRCYFYTKMINQKKPIKKKVARKF